MESRPQNPEFTTNHENLPMHVLLWDKEIPTSSLNNYSARVSDVIIWVRGWHFLVPQYIMSATFSPLKVSYEFCYFCIKNRFFLCLFQSENMFINDKQVMYVAGIRKFLTAFMEQMG